MKMRNPDLFGSYSNELLSKSIKERIIIWCLYGERGVSSNTICSVLSEIEKPEEMIGSGVNDYDTPHDPDDFRRCYLLLKLIPEWVDKLYLVAEKFPRWKGFVKNWDVMTALYEKELGSTDKKAPMLYKIMSEIESNYSKNMDN